MAVCPLSRSLFVSLCPGCQHVDQKMRFLDSIRLLLRTVQLTGLSEGLDIFCRRFRLVECTEVRGHLAAPGKGARPPGTL